MTNFLITLMASDWSFSSVVHKLIRVSIQGNCNNSLHESSFHLFDISWFHAKDLFRCLNFITVNLFFTFPVNNVLFSHSMIVIFIVLFLCNTIICCPIKCKVNITTLTSHVTEFFISSVAIEKMLWREFHEISTFNPIVEFKCRCSRKSPATSTFFLISNLNYSSWIFFSDNFFPINLLIKT